MVQDPITYKRLGWLPSMSILQLGNFHWYPPSSSREYKILVITLTHLIITLYSIFHTINGILEELSYYEIINCVVYYSIHFVLIAFLIFGTLKVNPWWYIPWLVPSFVVFTIATYLWVQSLRHEIMSYITLLNITVLGLFWCSWWTVAMALVSMKK